METGRSGVARRRHVLDGALGVAILIALVLAPVSGATAMAASPISVSQSDARSQFPTEIDFTIQATTATEITGLRLAYQVAAVPITHVAKVSFTPGPRVSASYKINLAQEYYPPGTSLQYRWLIQDQTGATAATSPAVVTVVDGRFSWQTATSGPVTLHWYQGNSQWVASMVATAAKVTQQAAANGASLRKSDVFLYANNQDFKSALGVGSEQWAGGESFPDYAVSLIVAPPDQTAIDQRSVAHELTHLLTDGAVDPFGPLPSWLDEGLSMVAEGPPDPVFTQALQDAVANHRLLSIQSISGNFPEDTSGATLAYAESQSLVRYLVATHGQSRLNALVQAYHQGASPDAAFQQAIGMTRLEFQNRWEASLGVSTPIAGASPASAASAGPSLLVRILSAPANLLEGMLHLLRGAGKTSKP